MSKLAKAIKDPQVILSRGYSMITGVSVRELQSQNKMFKGTISALAKMCSPIEIEALSAKSKNENELAELFNKYGSDKAIVHDYYRLYASLLNKDAASTILEIGLGTNNTDFPSNMGKNGKPGAAERAFRDWGSKFEVYGADIDAGILFQEDRIHTFAVDQQSPESLAELATRLPKFDLIIDDGLHRPHANFNTLNFALPLLKEGGHFVIEDILPRYLEEFTVMSALLSNEYSVRFIQCKREIVCLITRKIT